MEQRDPLKEMTTNITGSSDNVENDNEYPQDVTMIAEPVDSTYKENIEVVTPNKENVEVVSINKENDEDHSSNKENGTPHRGLSVPKHNSRISLLKQFDPFCPDSPISTKKIESVPPTDDDIYFTPRGKLIQLTGDTPTEVEQASITESIKATRTSVDITVASTDIFDLVPVDSHTSEADIHFGSKQAFSPVKQEVVDVDEFEPACNFENQGTTNIVISEAGLLEIAETSSCNSYEDALPGPSETDFCNKLPETNDLNPDTFKSRGNISPGSDRDVPDKDEIADHSSEVQVLLNVQDSVTEILETVPNCPSVKSSDPNRTINAIKEAIKSAIDSNEQTNLKKTMEDITEKLERQQQEITELKLQLNASQQARASLELEITQKDEIIIKSQAELMRAEQAHKQDIKQMKEELKENTKLIEQKDDTKDLEEKLKEARAREAKVLAELNQKNKDDINYQKTMEQYEKQILSQLAEFKAHQEDHEVTKQHLANLELAFSDLHSKYEKTKEVIQSYMANEEALVTSLEQAQEANRRNEEKYVSLKNHAVAQIDRSNQELRALKDKYETEINKLRAVVKRLEIKCSSLDVALQQKAEECEQLSALCDEVTGKKV